MELKRFHSLLGDMGKPTYYGELEVGRNQVDKMNAALIKLFVPSYDTRGVAAFESLKKAYIYFTGDSDISGFFKQDRISKDLRSCQDFNSATFAHALENAMNMYLSKTYNDFPYHEEVLISQKNTVTDFRKIKAVQLGYFQELPDVDPETADYADMAPYADTESEYDLSHKGAIVWVTRRHIIDDAIGLINDMVKRIARSARIAHAKYVWNFYKNNALCPDGTAWFTEGHGNLGNSALDISPLVTAITALANMTEPASSNEKIGLDLATFNWRLVVSIALWDLAIKKNQQDSYYSANDLTTKVPNPCQKLFGDRNERIITCPFLTDANDWGVIRDREDVPIVEMSYLNGKEDPEFIIESGPDSINNITFMADKIGYKVRHEYGGTLTDYRGGYKAIVV